MAHEIENMFSVRETPWHRLGTVLSEPPTTREAIVAAGLDWDVELRAMLTNGGATDVECARAAVRSNDHAAMVRDIALSLLAANSRQHAELCELRAENERLRAENAKLSAKRARRGQR